MKKRKNSGVLCEIHIKSTSSEKEKIIYIKEIEDLSDFETDFYDSTIIARKRTFDELKELEMDFFKRMNKIFE